MGDGKFGDMRGNQGRRPSVGSILGRVYLTVASLRSCALVRIPQIIPRNLVTALQIRLVALLIAIMALRASASTPSNHPDRGPVSPVSRRQIIYMLASRFI